METQRLHQRQVEINGKILKTPLKVLPDTTKRRLKQIDTQKFGKPDFSVAQAEESRTVIDEEKFDALDREDDDPKRKETVDKIKTRLKYPEPVDEENVNLAYFGMTKKLRRRLNKRVRTTLIEIAHEEDFDAVITPAIQSEDPREVRDTIDLQMNFAEDILEGDIQIIPTLEIGSLSIPEILAISNYIEDQYNLEELPIIGVRGFFPFSYISNFLTLRESTDRLLHIVDSRKRIYHSRRDEYGIQSAEQLLVHYGADMVSQYLHTTGGYSEEDPPESIEDIKITILNPGNMIFNEVSIKEADAIECDRCFIHKELPTGIDIEYFGSQQKADTMAALHNEELGMKEIEKLRNFSREEYMEYIRNKPELEEALDGLEEERKEQEKELEEQEVSEG